jgi:hypothetical protein
MNESFPRFSTKALLAMFPFNRKSGGQSKEAWNQAKADYEEAVRRCYNWKTVTLALCGFGKFVALNLECGLNKERKSVVEDDCKFWGVVHEQDKFSKHVRCEVKLLSAVVVDEYIGHFHLTHIDMPKAKTSRDEQALQLDVMLRDPTTMLKMSLIDGLRDAALSGFRFMHIQLECQDSTNEECEKALSDMRAQGCAYSRDILAVKTWPKIELQNAPEWSRREE